MNCALVSYIQFIPYKKFLLLQDELQRKPFDFNNKIKIKEVRKLLSDRILSLNKMILTKNMPLISILESNTIFGLSALNLVDEDYAGINYTYEQGLVIKNNESTII